MKTYTFTVELPDDWTMPDADDIKRLADPSWLADWWHVDDIKGEAEWLTDEQARDALVLIDKYSTPHTGINWDFIDDIIREHFPQPDDEVTA